MPAINASSRRTLIWINGTNYSACLVEYRLSDSYLQAGGAIACTGSITLQGGNGFELDNYLNADMTRGRWLDLWVTSTAGQLVRHPRGRLRILQPVYKPGSRTMELNVGCSIAYAQSFQPDIDPSEVFEDRDRLDLIEGDAFAAWLLDKVGLDYPAGDYLSITFRKQPDLNGNPIQVVADMLYSEGKYLWQDSSGNLRVDAISLDAPSRFAVRLGQDELDANRNSDPTPLAAKLRVQGNWPKRSDDDNTYTLLRTKQIGTFLVRSQEQMDYEAWTLDEQRFGQATYTDTNGVTRTYAVTGSSAQRKEFGGRQGEVNAFNTDTVSVLGSINGEFCSAFLTYYKDTSPPYQPHSQPCLEETKTVTYVYKDGYLDRKITRTYWCEARMAAQFSINYIYKRSEPRDLYVPLTFGGYLVEEQVEEWRKYGEVWAQTVTTYRAPGLTDTGRNAVQASIDAKIKAAQSPSIAVIGAFLYTGGLQPGVETEHVAGAQQTPPAPERGPGRAASTEQPAEVIIDFDEGEGTRTIRIPYLPLATYPTGGYNWSDVDPTIKRTSPPAPANIKAALDRFGRLQGRLLKGQSLGMDVVLPLRDELLWYAPGMGYTVQSESWGGRFLANGAAWAGSADESTASLDGLYLGFVGGTGPNDLPAIVVSAPPASISNAYTLPNNYNPFTASPPPVSGTPTGTPAEVINTNPATEKPIVPPVPSRQTVELNLGWRALVSSVAGSFAGTAQTAQPKIKMTTKAGPPPPIVTDVQPFAQITDLRTLSPLLFDPQMFTRVQVLDAGEPLLSVGVASEPFSLDANQMKAFRIDGGAAGLRNGILRGSMGTGVTWAFMVARTIPASISDWDTHATALFTQAGGAWSPSTDLTGVTRAVRNTNYLIVRSYSTAIDGGTVTLTQAVQNPDSSLGNQPTWGTLQTYSGGALSNNTPVNINSTGAGNVGTNEQAYWWIDVPSGQTSLVVTIAGANTDGYCFIARDYVWTSAHEFGLSAAAATINKFGDYFDVGGTFTLNNPPAGRYFIAISWAESSSISSGTVKAQYS